MNTIACFNQAGGTNACEKKSLCDAVAKHCGRKNRPRFGKMPGHASMKQLEHFLTTMVNFTGAGPGP